MSSLLGLGKFSFESSSVVLINLSGFFDLVDTETVDSSIECVKYIKSNGSETSEKLLPFSNLNKFKVSQFASKIKIVESFTSNSIDSDSGIDELFKVFSRYYDEFCETGDHPDYMVCLPATSKSNTSINSTICIFSKIEDWKFITNGKSGALVCANPERSIKAFIINVPSAERGVN